MRLPIKQPTEPLNPAEIIEARAKGLVTSSQALNMLDFYIKREFPDEKISNLVKDLSAASDTKFNKDVGFWEAPNWQARKNAIDTVLKLRGYLSKEASTERKVPTKVVFNTVVVTNEKIERTNKSHVGENWIEANKKKAANAGG